MSRFSIFLLVLALLLGAMLAACGAMPDLPEPAPVATSTPAPAPTHTPAPTLAPTPEPTPAPTNTPAPEPTTPPTESEPTPEEPQPAAPTAIPMPPFELNGVVYSDFILMDNDVKANIKAIYAKGQQQGRNARAFSKLGDSLIANPYFLRVFDQQDPNLGPYKLGDYAFLQKVIDYYAGSFDRYGVGIHVGLHTWSVFDPMWASKELCNSGETLLDCEIRLNNPSIMLVLLGTNDDAPQGTFEVNYDKIVRTILEKNVIPVLFTKADRFEGPDNRNNLAIRKIAAKYQVPLVDFDVLADTLPNRGTGPDNIHLSIADNNDYTDPNTYRFGNTTHNLSTLIMLDRLLATLGD
jgi:hypothetical protein